MPPRQVGKSLRRPAGERTYSDHQPCQLVGESAKSCFSWFLFSQVKYRKLLGEGQSSLSCRHAWSGQPAAQLQPAPGCAHIMRQRLDVKFADGAEKLRSHEDRLPRIDVSRPDILS